MTTTVYRVEHRDGGHGPYVNDDGVHWEVEGLHFAHEASKSHPGPRKDYAVGDYLSSRHSFGFSSRQQLDKWFKGFKRKLHAADYVIRVFEAPDKTTHISDHQAIFVKDGSRLVETLPVVRY